MKILISNRALPLDYGDTEMPARIHIVPRGELVNKEAGITQVLDDKALDSILDDLKNRHAQKGGLYMGEEHFIYDSEKSSQAFAWGKEFGKDEKGIWATKYDPTDVGAPAIKNQRFKFTSFCADPNTPGALENLGNGRVRVLKIDTVGFTNYANGKSLLTPIFNRNDLDNAPGGAASSSPQPNQRKKMKTVCTALGLSADAAEEAVLAEVSKLKNRIVALEPHEAENTKLKNRIAQFDAEQIDGLLAERKISDEKVVNRLKPVLATMPSRADRVGFLDECGFKAPEEKPSAKNQRVLNRGTGDPDRPSAGNDSAEREKATKIMNRAQQLQKDSPTLTLATAVFMAQKELE